jgi:hypothetical protein
LKQQVQHQVLMHLQVRSRIIKKHLESTVQNILSVRFVAGFFAPASPSVSLKSDMAEWARDNGSVNFKQTWNKLITSTQSRDLKILTAKQWLTG